MLEDYMDYQNIAKALEFWHRAAELGSAEAYFCLGIAYDDGDGVERDMKKARHYLLGVSCYKWRFTIQVQSRID